MKGPGIWNGFGKESMGHEVVSGHNKHGEGSVVGDGGLAKVLWVGV